MEPLIHCNKIVLKCVKEKSKLRIRFHCYYNEEGIQYFNSYNETYNCRFPKSIREEGKFYEIDSNDLNLVHNDKVSPFYVVQTKNITILDSLSDTSTTATSSSEIEKIKVFDVSECVICLSAPSSVTFVPCGHRCTCNDCYKTLNLQFIKQKKSASCLMCRRGITRIIVEEKETEQK